MPKFNVVVNIYIFIIFIKTKIYAIFVCFCFFYVKTSLLYLIEAHRITAVVHFNDETFASFFSQICLLKVDFINIILKMKYA